MNLLAIVQEFCLRQGLPKPSAVMDSRDDTLLQIVGLLNEVLDTILRRKSNWQVLQYSTTWQSLEQEVQGNIFELCPHGMLKITDETIYDQTRRLPIYGPKSQQEWALLLALQPTGPLYQYRIMQNQLLVFPTMPANHTLYFEYNSEWAVVTNAGPGAGTEKKYFTLDSDTCLFNDTLLLLGLRWRWRREKGLPYQENKLDFETALTQAASADGTAPTLSMDGSIRDIRPGILVPAGSWNIPGL